MYLAYLDTGTGAFLVQMLVGGAAGLAIFFRARWKHIKARVTGKAGAPTD